MGPCQYERDQCRDKGGRVFTARNEEVTVAVEAEYDRVVRASRFQGDSGQEIAVRTAGGEGVARARVTRRHALLEPVRALRRRAVGEVVRRHAALGDVVVRPPPKLRAILPRRRRAAAGCAWRHKTPTRPT
jgi:hypothetical protein